MDKLDFKFEKMKEQIVTPTFSIADDDEYVPYGEDNEMGDHLLSLYDNVALHRAIIDKKINLFLGEGFTFDAKENEKQSELTQKFIDVVNPYENLDSLMLKIAMDWFIFRGSYLAVKWNKTGTKILELHHLDFNKVRVGAADEFNNITHCYYRPTNDYDERWMNGDMLEKTDKKYPMFSTTENKGKTQVLFIKQYNITSPFYPLPDYFGARRQLDTLKRISEFWNDGIANGLMPSHSIFAYGEMSKEEREAFVKSLKSKYSQTDGGSGKPLVGVFKNKDQRVDIEAIEQSNLDRMYIQLAKDTIESVASAHQYPLTLAQSTPGKLGSANEVIQQMNIFIQTYIRPNQKQVLSFINGIFRINKLKEIDIITKDIKPTLEFDIIDPTLFLTEDEIRKEMGYAGKDADVVKDDVANEDNNEDKTVNNE